MAKDHAQEPILPAPVISHSDPTTPDLELSSDDFINHRSKREPSDTSILNAHSRTDLVQIIDEDEALEYPETDGNSKSNGTGETEAIDMANYARRFRAPSSPPAIQKSCTPTAFPSKRSRAASQNKAPPLKWRRRTELELLQM